MKTKKISLLIDELLFENREEILFKEMDPLSAEIIDSSDIYIIIDFLLMHLFVPCVVCKKKILNEKKFRNYSTLMYIIEDFCIDSETLDRII